MIQATIGLPIWNSEQIAWLPFESLCRQRGVDFKWELLIIEEKENAFGQDKISEYIDRLKEVGCISVKYTSLHTRIPLPQKWKFLTENRDKDSKAFLLQAADCYSEPFRLKRTMGVINNGFDWIQNKRGYFYSLHYKKLSLFDKDTFMGKCQTGMNIAFSLIDFKELPDCWELSGIDNWLYNSIKPKNVHWHEDIISGGVNTDGLNHISFNRRLSILQDKPPFNNTNKTLNDILPKDIAERIQKLIPR